MANIKYYIDNVRGSADSSVDLFYHYNLLENGVETKAGWMSYNSFKDDEESLIYQEAFWKAVLYWYEENNSIKYIIDNNRTDSFYHYTEFVDNVKVAEGWNIYIKLHLDKERTAWIKALDEYITNSNIETPVSIVYSNLEDIKNQIKLEEDLWPRHKSLIMPSINTALLKLGEAIVNKATTDDLIQLALECLSPNIPTPFAMLKYAFEAGVYNLSADCYKLLNNIKFLGLTDYVTPVIKDIEKICKTFSLHSNLLYAELSKECNKAIREWRKYIEECKNDDEEKYKEHLENFNNEISKFKPELQEILCETLYINSIVSISTTMKSLQNSTPEVWRNIIAEAKSLKNANLLSGNKVIAKLNKLFNTLIPKVGAMVGAFVGLYCGKVQEKKAALAGTKRSLDDTSQKDNEPDYNDLDDYKIINELGEEDIDDKRLEDDLYQEYVMERPKKVAQPLIEVGIVYRYAYFVKENYSFFLCGGSGGGGGNDNNDNDSDSDKTNNAENCDGCKVSMCETSDPTDTDSLIKSSGIFSGGIPIRPIVEIGKDMYPNAELKVYYKQHIRIGDIIGHIEGIPIKSKIDCIVDEVYPTYFVGTYYFKPDIIENSENPEDYIEFIREYFNSESARFSTEDFDEIVKLYTDSANVDRFIKDYLSFFRFPELALYTRDFAYDKMYHNATYSNEYLYNLSTALGFDTGYGTELSSDDFIEKYEKEATKIIDEYHKKVQKTCDKDNIQGAVDNGSMTGLKSSLDADKQEFTKTILDLYNNNPGQMNYCSKGRIVDFMLCDNWIEYLYGDNFIYDDDNPYVVELSEAISKFIGIRTKLELNADNIDSLVAKFNEYCDKVLSKYWIEYNSKYNYLNNYNNKFQYIKNYDYYSKFKEIFKYEYYLNNDSFDEGSEDDENSINLYKKILNYLYVVTDIQSNEEISNKPIEITLDTDVAALMKSFEDVKPKVSDNDELKRKLRKIAHRYISLLQIETSLNEVKVGGYGNTVSERVLNEYKQIDCFVARDYNGATDFFSMLDESLAENLFLVAFESTLNDYLNNLKVVTRNEVTTLRAIAAKAIDWYNENSEMVYSMEAFKKFLEIPWPDIIPVYKDCCITKKYKRPDEEWWCAKCDYWLFTDINIDEILNHTGTHGEPSNIPGYYKPLPGNSIIPPRNLDELKEVENTIALDKQTENKDKDLTTSVHSKTSGDVTKLKYWLKYCGIATIVNCIIPIFWATGINIMGAPILLPIIYLPLIVLHDRIITVIGLGICGVVPLPMILFVNPGTGKATIIPPVNMLVNVITTQLQKIGSGKMKEIELLMAPLILAVDATIKKAEEDKLDIDYQLDTVKTTKVGNSDTEYKTQRQLKKKLNLDTIFKAKNNKEV